MNYEDVTMNHEGQTLELAIDYDLTADQIKNIVWESSDESVATVSDKGVVTAVATALQSLPHPLPSIPPPALSAASMLPAIRALTAASPSMLSTTRT